MPSHLTAHPSDIPLKNLYNLLQSITLPPEKTHFTNWGRTFTCTPSAIFEPENEFQCELVLELARREGKTVRVAAVGHSPGDLACTTQYMLRTTKLNRVLEVTNVNFSLVSVVLKAPLIFSRSTPRNSMSSLREGSLSTIFILNWPRTTLP